MMIMLVLFIASNMLLMAVFVRDTAVRHYLHALVHELDEANQYDIVQGRKPWRFDVIQDIDIAGMMFKFWRPLDYFVDRDNLTNLHITEKEFKHGRRR